MTLMFILLDIDECSSGPCQNDGTCTDGIDEYTCNCSIGYTGADCETGILCNMKFI